MDQYTSRPLLVYPQQGSRDSMLRMWNGKTLEGYSAPLRWRIRNCCCVCDTPLRCKAQQRTRLLFWMCTWVSNCQTDGILVAPTSQPTLKSTLGWIRHVLVGYKNYTTVHSMHSVLAFQCPENTFAGLRSDRSLIWQHMFGPVRSNHSNPTDGEPHEDFLCQMEPHPGTRRPSGTPVTQFVGYSPRRLWPDLETMPLACIVIKHMLCCYFWHDIPKVWSVWSHSRCSYINTDFDLFPRSQNWQTVPSSVWNIRRVVVSGCVTIGTRVAVTMEWDE